MALGLYLSLSRYDFLCFWVSQCSYWVPIHTLFCLYDFACEMLRLDLGSFYWRVWVIFVLCVNGCIQDTLCLSVGDLNEPVSILFFCIYVSV